MVPAPIGIAQIAWDDEPVVALYRPSRRILPVQSELDRLHDELNLKRLSPLWAKLEIVLGLLAASSGLLIGMYVVARPAPGILWPLAAASAILQTLGGYLAMAGHRSHLYQSQNKLAAWLSRQLGSRVS